METAEGLAAIWVKEPMTGAAAAVVSAAVVAPPTIWLKEPMAAAAVDVAATAVVASAAAVDPTPPTI